MRSPYSDEVREQALKSYIEGKSTYQVAEDIGCTRPTVCNWLRDEGIEPRGKMPEPLLERFWGKVNVRGGDECWEWLAGTQNRERGEYGKFWVDGDTVPAHRFAYEISKGPIPEGLFVCHSCDNPKCVRPDHLWVGTNEDNMRDCIEKGRNDSDIVLNFIGGTVD